MIIGVLGGGQLGRMLALAGYSLGLRFRFYDHNPDAPAGQVGELIVGEFDDRRMLGRFCAGLDACTLEFENVPVPTLAFAASQIPAFPGPLALRTAQDRVLEKECFTRCAIPTTRYSAVDSLDQLRDASQRIGLPGVLKTRRMGYDGKGQAVVRSGSDVEAAWDAVGGKPSIFEEFIPFDREVSIIGARAQDGACVFYPLTRNEHREGILRISRAPACEPDHPLQHAAEDYARRIMDELGYVGVLAIEFFEFGSGLLANEMAPRVHNSGHWTIEGASVSQFENHIRAVAGLPLGAPRCAAHNIMINLIGTSPDPGSMLAVPGARVHLYGKAARPGRKLGHVTICSHDGAEAEARASQIRALVGGV